MKHRINVATGICSACGLSNTQKLTSSCYGHQLTSDGIKAVTTGKIDYHVMYGWFNPNDFMKLHPTPKPASHDVDNSGSMNYSSKPTYEIVSSDELPPEVHEMITQLMDDLGFTEDKPTNEELAKEMADVFGKAFKVREVSIKTESPDFSDHELELLQQIKDNPMPVSHIIGFGLSQPNMDRLRTLLKYGAVRVWENYYQVTIYGDGFLTEPEVFITDTELAFMLCCQRGDYLITEVATSQEAWNTYQALYKKGLVQAVLEFVVLTPSGNDHIAKLCSIPL